MDKQIKLLFFLISGFSLCSQGFADEKKPVRTFEFSYSATVIDATKGSKAQVWLPIAQSNGQQQVKVSSVTAPAPMQINSDRRYGNKIGYFETTVRETGVFAFALNYHVIRHEAKVDAADPMPTELRKKIFLSANRLVPTDGKPIELLKEAQLSNEPFVVGQQLYDIVEQHMSYDKSQPGYGNGDSLWACDSRTGNCTDFHSLFISLARSQMIPARFEIGFPLPVDKSQGQIGGYHCWAWFFADRKGWCPVDISEADKHPEMKDYYFGQLTADRVSFTTGRDIELVPASAGGPLNYFVYPYVEVDGKPWPPEKIKLRFFFFDFAKNVGVERRTL